MASSMRRDSLAGSARTDSNANFYAASAADGGDTGHVVGVPKAGHIHLAWRNVQRLMGAVRDSQAHSANGPGVDTDVSSDDGKSPHDRSMTPGHPPSRDRSPAAAAAKGSSAAMFCTNCRSDTHGVADCPEPSRCYVCHHPGHEAYVCVANPVPASIMFRADERCLICREPGHSAKACKSRGGPQHGRPGVQHIAGGCFPRPLVVHVSADSGPTPAQQRAAREAIAATLPAEVRSRFRSGELSDADLFLAGLSRLGESAGHDPALEALRGGLVTMRGPATAGLVAAVQPPEGALGGGAAALHRTRAAEQEPAAAGGGGGGVGPPLHELKASALDFHVVFGGRVSVFRRGKEGAGGGKQRSADEEAAEAAAVAGVPLDADIKARLDKRAQAAAAARTVQSAPEIVAAWPYKPGDEARFRERRRQQRLADEAKEKAAADAATSRERSAQMKMLKSQIEQAESKESARAASARAAAAASRKQQQQQQQGSLLHKEGKQPTAGFGASRRHESSAHQHPQPGTPYGLALDESNMDASVMSPTGHHPHPHAHAAFAAATAAASMSAHGRKASLSPNKGAPASASSPRGGSASPRAAATTVAAAADAASSRAGDAREALARSLRRTWSARARRVAPQPGSFDATVGHSPARAEPNNTTFVTGGGMASADPASPPPAPPAAANGGGGVVVASHADDLRRRLEAGDCRISTRFPGARINPRLTQWTAAAVRVDPSASGAGGTSRAASTARGPGTAATGTRAPSSRATESACAYTPRASPRERAIGQPTTRARGLHGQGSPQGQDARTDVPAGGDTPRVPNLHLSPAALAAASSSAGDGEQSQHHHQQQQPPPQQQQPRQPEPIKNWRAYSLLHAWKPNSDADAKGHAGHDAAREEADDAPPDHRATAERWRGRFEMSKLASTYATDVQLEARAVHRSIVQASPRAMAAVCERALSKGRRWLVSHSMGDAKRPSTAATPRGMRTPRPPSSAAGPPSSSEPPGGHAQPRGGGAGRGQRRKSMASRMAEAGAAEEAQMATLQRRREEAGGDAPSPGSDGELDLAASPAGGDGIAHDQGESSAAAAAADAEDACPSVWSEACLRMALEAVAVQVRAGVRKDVAAYLGRVKGPRGAEAARIVAAFHEALDELDRPPADEPNDIAAKSRRSPIRRPTLAFSTKADKSGMAPRAGGSGRDDRQAFTVSDAEAVSRTTRVSALGAADTEPRSIEGLRLLQLIDAVLVDAARTVSGATAS